MQTYFVKCKSNQYYKYQNNFKFTRKNGQPNTMDTMQLIDNIWVMLDLNKDEFIMMKERCTKMGLKIDLKADQLVNC